MALPIDTLSDEFYYSTPSEYGKNRYVTLENVIDNILLTADEDSYFKHTKRFRASILGKQGLKHIGLDIQSKTKAISFQLSPSKTFPYPRFMTDWIKISVVNTCGKLQTLNVNTTPAIQDYLQDDQYELLYDENGNILRANDFNAVSGTCYRIPCETVENACEDTTFDNSWVKDVRDGSYFEFSEDLIDKSIVIEFSSAGLLELKECDIYIHHKLELCIENWIKFNLLQGKRNVPSAEWKTYFEFYKLHRRNATSELADKITPEQMLKSIQLRYK